MVTRVEIDYGGAIEAVTSARKSGLATLTS